MPYTIDKPVTAEIKILRSRFIATLYPVQDVAEVRSLLTEQNSQYADATHNCYAYVLGKNKETTYYADAGEPSGTAGKPILNELLRHDLSNVLAVVTRYFGGIKLGVKGLIEAYGAAVAEAISLAETKELRDTVQFSIQCDYPAFEALKHKAAEWEGEISKLAYTDNVAFLLSLPRIQELQLKEFMDGLARQNRLHYSAYEEE